MSDLALTRLIPEDPGSWVLWPSLEARVRAVMPVLEPEAPADAVIRHLRTLWATQPARLGAWLALRPGERTNGHHPPPFIAAHMVAWVDSYWGEPCILVYQLEGDPGAGSIDLLGPMLRELEAWRGELDRLYEAAHSTQRVTLVRFYTTRPEAYRRWFQSAVATTRGATLVTFRLSEMALPSFEA